MLNILVAGSCLPIFIDRKIIDLKLAPFRKISRLCNSPIFQSIHEIEMRKVRSPSRTQTAFLNNSSQYHQYIVSTATTWLVATERTFLIRLLDPANATDTFAWRHRLEAINEVR